MVAAYPSNLGGRVLSCVVQPARKYRSFTKKRIFKATVCYLDKDVEDAFTLVEGAKI